ncbi:MAG: trigger factor [Desulfobulbaceae bacterium]|nr:trigger factor [Desulfobulbaceae bacterium]
MDIAVEEINELTRKVTVTLPAKQVRKALDESYKKLKKEVNLKGFRKGKIPMAVLEKNFKEQVQKENAEQLVQGTYFDAIEEKGIDAIVHPEITSANFGDDDTFTYVAMVDINPKIDLQDYKGIEIEKPITTVSEAEIDEQIETLRRTKAVLRTAEDDHEIVMDDIAIVDFQGFHEGKAMPEVQNEDFSVDIGTKSLGEEFETQLLGMKKGETTLHEIPFPPEYPNPVLAGKTVEFKVDVKNVKVRVRAEVDDEFAKDIDPEYETLEDLRQAVTVAIKQKKETVLEGDISDRLMSRLLDENQFKVPERLIMFEIQEMIKQAEENLKRSNMTLESAGIKVEDLVEQNRPVAEKRVQGDFLLKKIADIEEIKLQDEDIERGYQRIAGEYNMTLDKVKSYFKRREETLPFINELLNEKVLCFLREEANITEVETLSEEKTEESEIAEETTEK